MHAVLTFSFAVLGAVACNAGQAPVRRTPAGSSGNASGGSGAIIIGADGKLPDGTSVTALLPTRIRRLTNAEYDASVQTLTGTTATPGRDFAPDLRQDGFTVNGDQRVDPVLAKQLFAAAQTIAAEVKLKETCADASQAEACASAFIQKLGTQAYRRALDQAEVDALLTVYRAAATGATYADGIELVTAAILQSAGFLYVTELGGTPTNGVVTLTQAELASEMAYLFGESLPDAELAAADLTDPELRAAQARRLLQSATGKARVVRLIREWLGLDRLPNTAKDTVVYPTFDALKPSMDQETKTFVESVTYGANGTVGELLGTDATTADSALTGFYGSHPRRGILNQAAFLSVYAHASESAPVLRGVSSLRRVVCFEIGSPTELNINVVPPLPDPSKTTRQRFDVHATDAACAMCHGAIDSFGFAFEHFDGMGAYRDTDSNLPVDSSVTVALGGDLDGSYASSNELATALAKSPTVKACFARHMFHASAGSSGEAVSAAEESFVTFWQTLPEAAQGNIVETLVAFAKSSLFAQRRVP